MSVFSQRLRRTLVCSVGLLAACAAAAGAQFVPHAPFGFDRGQDVVPTFDGWVRNADGSYSLFFGYLNRNASEALFIPVGPANTLEPGGDRGQPSYFYPAHSPDLTDRDVVGRRRWWVFKVDAPSTWTDKERVTWTLISRGRTNRATGWLQPEYQVDLNFIRENTADGHLFSRGDFDAENRPPTVSGITAQRVSLPATATVAIAAADDGRPESRASSRSSSRRAAQRGLRVRWTTYRGPARVTFAEETDGPSATRSLNATTIATFSEAGEYRLRAIVSDGQLFSTHDVDVTVNPASTTPTPR